MGVLTAHLREVDETYWEHMACAAGFAWRLFAAGLVCAVHALLPFLLVHAASERVASIGQRMAARASAKADSPAAPAG